MFSKQGLVFAVHGLKLLSDSKKRSLHTLKLSKTVPSQTTAPSLEQVLQVDDSSIGLSVFFCWGVVALHYPSQSPRGCPWLLLWRPNYIKHMIVGSELVS